MSAELPLGAVPVDPDARGAPARTQAPPDARRPLRTFAPERPQAPAPAKALALTVSRAMGVVVVTGHGHIGASDSEVLRAVLFDLIEGQGNLKVVVDSRDISGIDRSSLTALADAVDAAALLGGELTFADPSDAAVEALEAVGLGDAITLARQCGQRAPASPAPGQANGEARRAARAQHPAGTGASRDHPWSLAGAHECPTTSPR